MLLLRLGNLIGVKLGHTQANLGTTWALLAPNSGKLAPTWDMRNLVLGHLGRPSGVKQLIYKTPLSMGTLLLEGCSNTW